MSVVGLKLLGQKKELSLIKDMLLKLILEDALMLVEGKLKKENPSFNTTFMKEAIKSGWSNQLTLEKQRNSLSITGEPKYPTFIQ